MSKSQHGPVTGQRPMNQNNQMSDDPEDGSRRSFVLGRDGEKSAAETSPEDEDQQEQSAIEAFGEEGAGIAAQE